MNLEFANLQKKLFDTTIGKNYPLLSTNNVWTTSVLKNKKLFGTTIGKMIHDEHSRSCLKGQFAAFEEKKASTIWKKSSVTTICKTSFWDGHSKKEIIKKINAEFTFTSFRYFYLFFTNITATLLLVRLLLIFVSVVL